MAKTQNEKIWTAIWYLQRDMQAEGLQQLFSIVAPRRADMPRVLPQLKVPVVAPGREAGADISIGDALAEIAESQLGVREVGNNGGERVREYQAITTLGTGTYAWCASFICWCCYQVAKQHAVRWNYPRTAGARDLYNWAIDIDNRTGHVRQRSGGLKAGVRVLDLTRERLRRGDVIIFDRFSHCGIVRYDETSAQFEGRAEIDTIEGNTNREGARDGDGCYSKRRSVRSGSESIRHAIRLTI